LLRTDAADTLALLVHTLGGDARTAGDGIAAVQAASEFRPDVILLDIDMPGVDGYETCRQMRHLPAGAGVVIVALTGLGQEQDKGRAFDAGFDAHLTKPADPDVLRHVLANPQRRPAHAGHVDVAGGEPRRMATWRVE
jgi:CheY-like chemotaxis protein